MTHLFLFTIGPVQGFIAQARKTRDLKAGSQLLSELVQHAWETCQGVDCIKVIAPIMPDFSGGGLPNRFLAEVAFEDETQAHKLGEKTAQAVKDKLVCIAMDLLKIKIKQESGDFRARFEAQIRDHLEVHWVINKLGEDYQASYLETESLLGAVKATRTFGQLPDDEANRKCSVTGERDALVFPDSDRRPSFSINKGWAKAKGDEIQMAEGEGLSAIAFAKRFYDKVGTFPSTAEVALMEWLINAKAFAPNELKELSQVFGREDQIDGQLLFEENLTEWYLSRHGYESKAKNSDLIREKLSRIKRALPDHVKQTSYYALIAFDGDKMGSWWSGDTLNTPDLKSFQLKLTGLLSEYAKWAVGYLEAPMGKAVYAGGDDFLGFINLQHLFPVLETLQNEFQKQVSNKTGVDEMLTFSAGVAIAHYKTPLNLVLETARMMEHAAKDAGRNRLGIKVLMHSSGAETAVMTWEELPKMKLVVDHLQRHVSDKFVGDLAREIMQVSGIAYLEQEGTNTLPQEAWEAELKRLIKKRKTEPTYDPALLASTIIELLDAEPRYEEPRMLIDLLSIAMFIERTTFSPHAITEYAT